MRIITIVLTMLFTLYGVSNAQLPSYVPANGLIGWWPCNGNANDVSGNGNNGTTFNVTLSTDKDNVANSAYSYNGTNSKIEVNANAMFDLQKLTISVWIYSTQAGSQKLISKSNWANAGSETFSLYLASTGELALNTKFQSNCIGGNGWRGPVVITKPADFHNKWHHIVVTYDNAISRMYIDGCLVKESISAYPMDICSGGQLKFGAWWNGDQSWFKGKLDDIGLWNRALSQTEVKNLYDGSNPISATFPESFSVSCIGKNDASATVTVAGGIPPYSFVWNTNPVQTSQTAVGLSPGNYSVTVSDSKCQSTSSSVLITEPNPISASIYVNNPISCVGGNDGSAAISNPTGGTPPYSFEWSTNPVQKTQTAVNLSAGIYSAIIKDSKGCQTELQLTIEEPKTPISNVQAIAVKHIACYGDSTGIVTVSTPSGGTPPYVYNWHTVPMKTTQTVENLPAGIYKVVVADSKGCFLTSTIELTQPQKELSDIEFEIIREVDCNGNNSGSIAIKNPTGGTPPYNYSWNTDPPQFTQTIKNVPSGRYTATVKDKNNCTKTETVELIQPDKLLVDVNILQNVTCYGEEDGIALARATGGTPPYNFIWSTIPSQSADTAKNLKAGEYIVSVADSKGCVSEARVVISQPEKILNPIISAIQEKNYFCKGDSRKIILSPVSKYQTYTWYLDGKELLEFKNKEEILAFTPGRYHVTSIQESCIQESNTLLIEERELPKPKISGQLLVEFDAKGVEYSTPYNYGSSYKWTVERNAKIIDAADKHYISVDFQSNENDSVYIHVLETDSNYCVKDTFIVVSIQKTTDVWDRDGISSGYSVKRFDKTLEIEWENSLTSPLRDIEMYDVLGREMKDISYIQEGNDRIQIDIESLRTGVYLLLLRYENKIYQVSFFVE